MRPLTYLPLVAWGFAFVAALLSHMWAPAVAFGILFAIAIMRLGLRRSLRDPSRYEALPLEVHGLL
jgi:hypothetical protein